MQPTRGIISIPLPQTEDCEIAPPRELQVPNAMARTANAIDVIDKGLAELHSRLVPVLRSEPCDHEAKDRIKETPPNTLFDQLHEHAARLERIGSVIQAIPRLLEI